MKKQILWLDILRVFAMILVVVGHAFYFSGHTLFGDYCFENKQQIYNLPYRFFTVLTAFIYSFHMPLFMALSGACFRISSGSSSYQNMIKKKAKRLLVPFALTALFLSIPIRVILGYYKSCGNNPIVIFAHHFIFPEQIHLWFLLSLFLIFPMFYFLRYLHDKNRIIFWTTLIIVSYTGHIMEIPTQNVMGLPTALKQLLYFSVGYYSINFILGKKSKLISLCISIIMQITFFYIYVKFLEPLSFAYCFVIILALWGCYNSSLICQHIAQYRGGGGVHNSMTYQLLLKYNFPIYLYSDPFNYIFLISVFSIPAIDFFGNPSHTLLLTILRIILGITFSIFLAKIIETIPNLIKKAQLSK